MLNFQRKCLFLFIAVCRSASMELMDQLLGSAHAGHFSFVTLYCSTCTAGFVYSVLAN